MSDIPNLEDLVDVLPLKRGSEPHAPDIAEPVEGLMLLKASEQPVAGQHFVLWGSVLLNDIRERPVKRRKVVSEDEYVERLMKEARQLVVGGVKNPKVRTDPATGKALLDSEPGGEMWDRVRRAEYYARWRYKGFVCAEVHSL